MTLESFVLVSILREDIFMYDRYIIGKSQIRTCKTHTYLYENKYLDFYLMFVGLEV